MIKKFETNKTYYCSSVCDSECIWKYKIIKRTAKTITIQEIGKSEISRRKINIWDNQETVMPMGNYSMAPSLKAERIVN